MSSKGCDEQLQKVLCVLEHILRQSSQLIPVSSPDENLVKERKTELSHKNCRCGTDTNISFANTLILLPVKRLSA
jgi:hypothetical protein